MRFRPGNSTHRVLGKQTPDGFDVLAADPTRYFGHLVAAFLRMFRLQTRVANLQTTHTRWLSEGG